MIDSYNFIFIYTSIRFGLDVIFRLTIFNMTYKLETNPTQN
jgi:hypothetical protein